MSQQKCLLPNASDDDDSHFSKELHVMKTLSIGDLSDLSFESSECDGNSTKRMKLDESNSQSSTSSSSFSDTDSSGKIN